MINIVTLQLGPVMTNAYLVSDPETSEAVVIDPAWDGHIIVENAKVIHADIDPAEIGKNVKVHLPIVADGRPSLLLTLQTASKSILPKFCKK